MCTHPIATLSTTPFSHTQTAEFWTTGLEPIAVSAISGSGTGDMMDHMVRRLPHLDKNVEEEVWEGDGWDGMGWDGMGENTLWW